jgi:hypothetical protein
MYSRALLIEEAWDREIARYDDVRERYHREIEDMRRESETDNDYYEYMWKVKEAGFGDDDEAYEANWLRTIQYGLSGAVDDIIYES